MPRKHWVFLHSAALCKLMQKWQNRFLSLVRLPISPLPRELHGLSELSHER